MIYVSVLHLKTKAIVLSYPNNPTGQSIPFDELSKKTARLISNGNIVGWFQDRMEFGPRALGNRSILADPRNEKMQKKLNLKIKYREGFRPFAPSVLFENVSDYFDIESPSPYMLLIADVNDKIKNPCQKII